MSDGSFTLTVSCVDGDIRVTAAGTPDCWCSLHARLLVAGAEALSVPSSAHGVMAGSFYFPASVPGVVCPEGYELDAFMRRLFVGLGAAHALLGGADEG